MIYWIDRFYRWIYALSIIIFEIPRNLIKVLLNKKKIRLKPTHLRTPKKIPRF